MAADLKTARSTRSLPAHCFVFNFVLYFSCLITNIAKINLIDWASGALQITSIRGPAKTCRSTRAASELLLKALILGMVITHLSP